MELHEYLLERHRRETENRLDSEETIRLLNYVVYTGLRKLQRPMTPYKHEARELVEQFLRDMYAGKADPKYFWRRIRCRCISQIRKNNSKRALREKEKFHALIGGQQVIPPLEDPKDVIGAFVRQEFRNPHWMRMSRADVWARSWGVPEDENKASGPL
jgi:hypothetical protein